MTLKELTAMLTPLALAMRAPLDGPTFRAYHRMLQDVPVKLLERAVAQAGKTAGAFFPSAGELRTMAEAERKLLLEAHPYEACPDCRHVGWLAIRRSIPPQYVRCKCWERYQAKLVEIGLSSEPILIEQPAKEFTRIGEGG